MPEQRGYAPFYILFCAGLNFLKWTHSLCLTKGNKAHIKIQSLPSSILDADHSDMAHAFPSFREMPLPTDWPKENKK